MFPRRSIDLSKRLQEASALDVPVPESTSSHSAGSPSSPRESCATEPQPYSPLDDSDAFVAAWTSGSWTTSEPSENPTVPDLETAPSESKTEESAQATARTGYRDNPAAPPSENLPLAAPPPGRYRLRTPRVSRRDRADPSSDSSSVSPLPAPSPPPPPVRAPRVDPTSRPGAVAPAGDAHRNVETLFHIVREKLYSRLNVSAALTKGRDRIRGAVTEQVAGICSDERLPATATDQIAIVTMVLDDMFGVGPIEPLLADPSITDILVNGPHQVYVERMGRLELTDVRFRDDNHVTAVAQRIAASIGRRVDESSPMVDARLADGSRVNVILPPLALDGACISIRKFAKRRVGFEEMIPYGTISPNAAKVLEIAGACRLNIVISGGTGSGKTTMMNAVSRKISPRERIVTIEDAAELQLQQPHIVRLETRASTAEGVGEVSMRDLMRNALRMRPDRIIIGECRGTEAFDLLQAMNTGHDGSMSTIHANSPRDALTRLENMVLMSNGNLPILAIRQQIASAVNLVVQVERMRDGVRRATAITEVVGMEGDIIITQDLFWFEFDMTDDDDRLIGRFKSSGIRPHFIKRAAMFGLADPLMEAMR